MAMDFIAAAPLLVSGAKIKRESSVATTYIQIVYSGTPTVGNLKIFAGATQAQGCLIGGSPSPYQLIDTDLTASDWIQV